MRDGQGGGEDIREVVLGEHDEDEFYDAEDEGEQVGHPCCEARAEGVRGAEEVADAMTCCDAEA